MANCLRRNFKSCRSLALIGRRNQQTSCLDQKTSNALTPILEVAVCDYSPLTVPRIADYNPRVISNLQVSTLQWKDINSIYHLKNLSCSYENDANKRGLGDSHVYCARECKAYKEDQNDLENSTGRPNKGQLDFVSNVLVEDLPALFTKTMNYKIYHQNVIFENNIKGTKTIGLFNYVKEIALIKIIGHIKFSQIKFHILKITVHPEDGTVRVRWRISGITNFKAFVSLFNPAATKDNHAEGWYDGFSVFYVRSDGLVHKHIVDKMMPDSPVKNTDLRDHLAAKVAFALGIMMKDFSAMSSLSFEEMQEKYPKLFDILHPLEQLEYFSNRSNLHDMQITLSELNCNSSQDN